jgi:hypothetical protein
VGVDEAKPVAFLRVLERHLGKQGGFARARAAYDVHAAGAVLVGERVCADLHVLRSGNTGCLRRLPGHRLLSKPAALISGRAGPLPSVLFLATVGVFKFIESEMSYGYGSKAHIVHSE